LASSSQQGYAVPGGAQQGYATSYSLNLFIRL
jgi:hypothetical protein